MCPLQNRYGRSEKMEIIKFLKTGIKNVNDLTQKDWKTMLKNMEKDQLILSNQLLEKQCTNLSKAYEILMDYFDCIPEEEREEVSKKLEKVGY